MNRSAFEAFIAPACNVGAHAIRVGEAASHSQPPTDELDLTFERATPFVTRTAVKGMS